MKDTHASGTDETGGRVLTDGGEAEAEEEGSDEGTNDEAQEDASQEQSQESEQSGEEGSETNVLDLNLDGLDLDLLGLEVHLDEVDLDVVAVEEEGNLVGNLLTAVAHLLDGGLQDLLSGLLNPLDGIGEKLSDAFSGFFDNLSDSASNALRDVPVREIFVQVLVGVIRQLLSSDSSKSEGGEDTEAEAEA